MESFCLGKTVVVVCCEIIPRLGSFPQLPVNKKIKSAQGTYFSNTQLKLVSVLTVNLHLPFDVNGGERGQIGGNFALVSALAGQTRLFQMDVSFV